MKLLLLPIDALSASLLKYIVAALLIFIPLYPKFPLLFLYKSSVAIRVEDFLILFAVLILLLRWYVTKAKINSIPLFRQITTYWLIGGLSVLSAILITKSITPQIGLLHWFRRIEYMVGFFMTYQIIKDNPKNLRFFYELIILAATGVLLYGLAQIYLGAPIISTMNEEFSKGYTLILQPGVPISSTFAGHYDLAIYLVFILSFLAALSNRTTHKIISLGFAVLFTGELWLLLQTGLRTAAFASLLCVSVIFLITRRPKLLFIFWIVFIFAVANTPRLTGRFDSFFRIFQIAPKAHAQEVSLTPTLRPLQQDRSTSIRLDVEWPRAWRAFLKNPFLGTGYSSITLATDNDYLRTLGETGLLGFLSFTAILMAITVRVFHLFKSKVTLLWQTTNLAYLGMLLGILFIAFFIDVFEASKIATFFWLITGCIFAEKYEKNI